jgi:hypothetical protein
MSAEHSSTAYTPDGLVIEVTASRQITLISGQNLSRGALLGKITASGKYTLSLAASGDGSEVPDLILAEDTDASAGDAVTVAYAAAVVDENEVTVGTGHTADSVREGLRVKGIHLMPSNAR